MTVIELQEKLREYPEHWNVLIEMRQRDNDENNVFQGDELRANNVYCAGQGEVCISI